MKYFVYQSFVLLLSLSLVVTASAQDATDYPNADLLVEVAWLADRTDEPDVRIIDMRPASAYADGHIPGAATVPVDSISSTINNISMEFDRDEVQSALNRIGLTPEMTVVIYDNLGMMNSARMFWTLEYVGHDDVRVLNGGWNAWVAADLPTSTDDVTFEATDYPIELDANRIIDAEGIVDRLGDPDTIIVDARAPEEYTGEVALAQRGGHIPGAVLFTWLDALTEGTAVFAIESDWVAQLRDDEVEQFIAADEIQALLDERGITSDKTVITYCQTFWRGAHVYFLLRLMGFEDVRAYDGSWSEWGNSSDLPIVTGDEPGTAADAG